MALLFSNMKAFGIPAIDTETQIEVNLLVPLSLLHSVL
jgi:hypothetical protein